MVVVVVVVVVVIMMMIVDKDVASSNALPKAHVDVERAEENRHPPPVA